MKRYLFFLGAITLTLALGAVACDGDEVTGAGRSLVRLSISAPDTARSGESFDTEVRVENVGLGTVRNGRVSVTLPLPLGVLSVGTSPGSDATFTNGLSGGRVDWNLQALDSNTQARLTIRASGTLLPTESTKTLTLVANMTADGINSGEAVARDDVTLVR